MTRFRISRLIGGFLLAAPSVAAAQSLVVVDPAGPVRTVTEALTRVTPGGRITVRAGTYAEPVYLDLGRYPLSLATDFALRPDTEELTLNHFELAQAGKPARILTPPVSFPAWAAASPAISGPASAGSASSGIIASIGITAMS